MQTVIIDFRGSGGMWSDEHRSIHMTKKQRKAVEEKMLKDRAEQLAKQFNLPTISINRMDTVRENIMEKRIEQLEKEFNPAPKPINKIVDLRKISMHSMAKLEKHDEYIKYLEKRKLRKEENKTEFDRQKKLWTKKNGVDMTLSKETG
jgi:hypothetical protein